jgi:hypothetical protein
VPHVLVLPGSDSYVRKFARTGSAG